MKQERNWVVLKHNIEHHTIVKPVTIKTLSIKPLTAKNLSGIFFISINHDKNIGPCASSIAFCRSSFRHLPPLLLLQETIVFNIIRFISTTVVRQMPDLNISKVSNRFTLIEKFRRSKNINKFYYSTMPMTM